MISIQTSNIRSEIHRPSVHVWPISYSCASSCRYPYLVELPQPRNNSSSPLLCLSPKADGAPSLSGKMFGVYYDMYVYYSPLHPDVLTCLIPRHTLWIWIWLTTPPASSFRSSPPASPRRSLWKSLGLESAGDVFFTNSPLQPVLIFWFSFSSSVGCQFWTLAL